MPPPTLTAAAVEVLTASEPPEKARLSHAFAKDWRDGRITEVGHSKPPPRPSRPARPALKRPRDMKRRRINANPAGRIALLHAVAHIELNAIDLAWDIVARFAEAALPRAFYDDWVSVADEEAKHFSLVTARLESLGASYGDLPAHDGLWQAAEETAHDLLARLAVVPLVLEARGLDVTPGMIDKLTSAGDGDSAAALQVIYDEEIGHVAIGKRWFDTLCVQQQRDPVETWQGLVRQHFKGTLKAPFNEAGRDAAGFPSDFYAPLAN